VQQSCWFAQCHSDLTAAREFLSLLLQFKQSLDSRRHNRHIQVLREQTDAFHKRSHLAILSAGAFGEYQHTVALINAFAREIETAAEAALLRQRKHVEQSNDEQILAQADQPFDPTCARGWMPPTAQDLTLHCDGQLAVN